MNMFPKFGEKALSTLIPFATTYLCESEFSNLLSIKTKPKNRLNAQANIRIAISNTIPRFKNVLCNKYKQKSH